MTIDVTLKLSEPLIEHAQKLGTLTQRDVGTVLSDALELLWLTVEDLPDETVAIKNRSDSEVLALADSKVDEVQNQRLGTLQTKGKAQSLTYAERYELLALLQIYQLGQLYKSEALAEAARRGLSNAAIA